MNTKTFISFLLFFINLYYVAAADAANGEIQSAQSNPSEQTAEGSDDKPFKTPDGMCFCPKCQKTFPPNEKGECVCPYCSSEGEEEK